MHRVCTLYFGIWPYMGYALYARVTNETNIQQNPTRYHVSRTSSCYLNSERSPSFNVIHATIASGSNNYIPPFPANSQSTIDDSPMNDRMSNVNARPNSWPSTESEDHHWHSRDKRHGARSGQPSNAHQVRHRGEQISSQRALPVLYPKSPTNPLPASRAGTRSVNRLSAAQLARKRANDREAQRAIRQRTKDHIDFLERRVEQLKDPEKERRTWNLHMRNRQLEEEIATLRDRINALETRNTGAMDAGAPLSDPMAGLDCDMRPDGLPMWWRTLDMGFPG
ncbi:hypothetical protein ACLOAV_010156 [Pseudogymnoascus australis]